MCVFVFKPLKSGYFGKYLSGEIHNGKLNSLLHNFWDLVVQDTHYLPHGKFLKK